MKNIRVNRKPSSIRLKSSIIMSLVLSLTAMILFISAGQTISIEKTKAEKFKVISTKASKTIKDAEPLMDSRGIILGSYLPFFSEEEFKFMYRVYPKRGESIIVDALSYIQYSGKAERIITYGSKHSSHVVGRIHLNIFTQTGQLIKSIEDVAQAPCEGMLADDGSVYIAGGYVGQKGITEAMKLTKYSSTGWVEWEKVLPFAAPSRITQSQDGKYIAVIQFDIESLYGIISIFNQTGELVKSETKPEAILGADFLSDDRIVFCTKYNWYSTNLNTFSQISEGKVHGTPLSKHPLTCHPNQDWFTIVCLDDPELNTGYRIQAINVNTGNNFRQSIFEGTPYLEQYRLAPFTRKGTIDLILDDRIVELEATSNK